MGTWDMNYEMVGVLKCPSWYCPITEIDSFGFVDCVIKYESESKTGDVISYEGVQDNINYQAFMKGAQDGWHRLVITATPRE